MFNTKKFFIFHGIGIFVCLICFIVFNISISAETYDPLFDDFANFPEFPRTSSNYIIMFNSSTNSNGGYYVYFIDDVELSISLDGTISTNSSIGVFCKKMSYDSNGLPIFSAGNYSMFYKGTPFYYHNSNQTIIASTLDIKNSDGTFFFYGMPLSRHAVWKTTTAQTLQQKFLITMAGLVKFLIPLLVGLVGFWKAWRLLLQLLRMG